MKKSIAKSCLVSEKTASASRSEGAVNLRPAWDDGRGGGYVGPPLDSFEANDLAYRLWVQSMERGG